MRSEEENQPEEVTQITPEEYLEQQKASMRKSSWWAIGIGAFLTLAHLVWLPIVFKARGEIDFAILFRSIFFILALFVLLGGIWGLYYSKSLSLKDVIPSADAVKFLQEARTITPYYTYILVGSVIAVFISQLAAQPVDSEMSSLERSRDLAGIVKPLVYDGEIWRLLTGATLHGHLLHIYFNGQALYGLAGLVEYLSNRAHLAIVFLLSIILGSLFSLYFMPDTPSVGASGGIMGIIGYLVILGFRRKQQLPPDFLKSMLINVGFIAAFGLVAYQIIDNFAHLGGFLMGVVYGFIQIPTDLSRDPRVISPVADFFGMLSMGVFVFTAILSVLLILEQIKF